MRIRRRRSGFLILLAVSLAACSTPGGSDHSRASSNLAQQPPIVYVAVGASETVGVGATEPTRDAWPQVLFRVALPRSTVFYNFGIPGATVATALTDELPGALSVQPTLVTVWLNVNDITGGVTAQRYEADLDHLVSALRRGGSARVLIANTPYLDRLPAYLECRAGLPLPQGECPPPLTGSTTSELNNQVDAYNSAIARVAQDEGAVVVDLHAAGEVPDAHPDWVSGDGFHPSTNGYNAIAAEFAAALKQTAR